MKLECSYLWPAAWRIIFELIDLIPYNGIRACLWKKRIKENESYIMEDGNSYLFFIVGVGCIVSMAVNIIRIRQCKEFLMREEYED